MTVRIYLDTNIFIAAFENQSSSASVWPILNEIEAGKLEAATSQITLAELLPKPIARGQTDLVTLYEGLFATEGFFDALPATIDVLTEAARIRAGRLSLKLPNAIHLATARLGGCRAVLTADQRMSSEPDLPIISLGPDSLEHLRALTS